MAEVIWTEPALEDLDALAEYIALDRPEPASNLVRRVFARVESGSACVCPRRIWFGVCLPTSNSSPHSRN